MGAYDGKVVWITGGGTGIGKALAIELARQGAKVAVSGRRQDRLDSAVTEIGNDALGVACDVTDEESQQAAVDAVVAKYGRLDVVVANAGFGVGGKFTDNTAAHWRRQMEVNVVGLTTTARLAIPELEKTKGSIVLIGSVAAFLPLPKNCAYGASKAAVRSIGATLSIELASSGIAVTTIHPGFVESEIAQVDNDGVHRPDRVDKRPSGLMWKAEDAARVMARAIAKRKREFVFTGHGKVGVFIGRHFPNFTQLVMSRS